MERAVRQRQLVAVLLRDRDRWQRLLARLDLDDGDVGLILGCVQPHLGAQFADDVVVRRGRHVEDEGRSVEQLVFVVLRARLAQHPPDDLLDANKRLGNAIEVADVCLGIVPSFLQRLVEDDVAVALVQSAEARHFLRVIG